MFRALLNLLEIQYLPGHFHGGLSERVNNKVPLSRSQESEK